MFTNTHRHRVWDRERHKDKAFKKNKDSELEFPGTTRKTLHYLTHHSECFSRTRQAPRGAGRLQWYLGHTQP